MNNFIKKLIFKIKQKMSKNKIKIGELYEIVKTPEGKTSSNFLGNTGDCSKILVKVTGVNNSNTTYLNCYNVQVMFVNGMSSPGSAGWVFDYELKTSLSTSEDLKNQIVENLSKMENLKIMNDLLKTKLEFMTHQGIEIYSEEEFKTYLVLKELGIDDFEKAKNIIKILNN